MRNRPRVQTRSGHYFDPQNASVSKIEIVDIAHSLSNICRYNGHCKRFYSVAEHAVLTYEIARKLWPNDLDVQWAALLHDASEAYVGDVTSPLKAQLPKYREIEDSIQDQIATEFNIVWSKHVKEAVHKVDVEALATEAPMLFKDVSSWGALDGVDKHTELLRDKFPLTPYSARELFLKTYTQIRFMMETRK